LKKLICDIQSLNGSISQKAVVLHVPFILTMKKIVLFFSMAFLNISMFAQNEGNILFGMSQVHDVYMTFSQSNFWDSLTTYYPIDQYLKGNVTIDGVTYPNVGIKLKGNSSYNNPSDKKSFKVDMNEYVAGQDIDGLKKFNLNNGFKDPTFLREKITCDFYNEHGLHAPRCAFAKVYLNGTYWGLYTFVEEVDTKQFLNAHFNNRQGNMFKGDPSGDLKWFGSAASSYYAKYELHTNETVNDWNDLVDFINKINNSGVYFTDSLEKVLNTSTFIEQWAALNLFSNLDSYIGSGHNYFIYHDTLSDKFEWVVWDVNESFGNFTMGMTATQMKNLSLFFVSSPSSNRPLVQKMLANTAYKTTLANTVCQWIQYDFSNGGLDWKIDSLANAIIVAVYADTKKFYSNQNFEDNLTSDITLVPAPPGGGTMIGLKPFITARRNALATELAAYSCAVGINENEIAADNINIYPNPAANSLQINYSGANITLALEYSISDYLGKIIISGTTEANKNIDVSNLESGLYFIMVQDEQKNLYQGKFVKQ